MRVVASAPTTAPRPDAGPSVHASARGGWATLAVVAVILVIVLGGYVTSDVLSEPAGAPVGVGGVVKVRPLSGWRLAGRGSEVGVPFARITRGSGNLDTAALVGRGGDAKRLAADYARMVLSRELNRLSVSSRLIDVSLPSDLRAVRFAYVGVVAETGASVEGEVTAAVTPSGNGVVFDGWAPAGLLSFVRSDIQTMIAHVEVV